MRLLVPLQVACFCCFVFTLVAMMQIFPGVPLDMAFEVDRIITRIVALVAFVRFFPGVLLNMPFEG